MGEQGDVGERGRTGLPVSPGRLVGDEGWADPWPTYRAARERGPIHEVPEDDGFLVLGWTEAELVLREPRFSSSPRHRRVPLDAATSPIATPLPVLLFLDPPDHTRLRRLVSHAFTPRRVEHLRARIVALVDELLDVVDPAGFELISALGFPLPVTVICELLGIPAEDQDRFGPWSSAASRLLDGDLDAATLGEGLTAVGELMGYLGALFDERRRSPRDDLLSALVAVEEEGDRLSEDELRAIVLLLFVAGHETTTNLLGNGTAALLQHPDQWAHLAADPSLVPGAVEELLRFDGPVHVTARVATEDLHLRGTTIEAGQGVVVHLAAANRDPARFSRPDELRVTRPDVQQLTFGHGIHYCLGAALARIEGQVAFAALARRFPDLHLTAEPQRRAHRVLRGHEAVHVAAG